MEEGKYGVGRLLPLYRVLWTLTLVFLQEKPFRMNGWVSQVLTITRTRTYR